MLAKFMAPTHIIQNVLEDDMYLVIWLKMEELVKLNENHSNVGENMNHIQLLGEYH
jgi:hypothetical protein